MTFKLPSYATCLRAKIRPKNYTALKQYYELLAKDEKLAEINQKHFINRIDNNSSLNSKERRSLSTAVNKAEYLHGVSQTAYDRNPATVLEPMMNLASKIVHGGHQDQLSRSLNPGLVGHGFVEDEQLRLRASAMDVSYKDHIRAHHTVF